jgi:activator of HSP90 ATPase
MKTKVKTIKQKVIIPASPKEVYDAYVDPKKQGEFTGSKATGKAVVGGKFTAWDGYIFGKYLALEDGKRVVQEWTSTDFPEGAAPSKLELCFNKTAKGTELVMVHSGVPEEIADDADQGWIDWYWEPLKEYFSGKGHKPKK